MSAAPKLDPYAAIEALNWSTLKHIAVSPRMLKWRTEHPRPETPALRLGTAIHCAILEPERFKADYISEPDFGDLRTNAAKAKRAAWLAKLAPGRGTPRPYFDGRTSAGKKALASFIATLEEGATIIVGDEDPSKVVGRPLIALSADDAEVIRQIVASVREHPAASAMLRGGVREETVTWVDSETGIRCKGRLDLLGSTGVVDVKSTRRESVWQMGRDIAALRYHAQLAWYHDGAIAAGRLPRDASLPRFVFVQTVEPFDVAPMELREDDFEKGRAHYRELLKRYAACEASGWWPGIAPNLIPAPVPDWAPGDLEPNEDW